MQVPDKAIPRDLLARAKAIAVFPQVIKVALTVGGEGGRGVVSRHVGAGWGNPVFVRAGGGSVGLQIGASSTDFFLLLMNDEGVDGLMKDKFELGGEAGIAAGPVGRNAGAATDALMHAEILSYSRSRGLFAGVNVKGIVLKPEDDLNVAVYNRTARELLGDQVSGDASAAAGLQAFPQALGRYTVNPSNDR
jgi:SH3 domain-containing YSC84-like protein 1